MIKYLRWLSKWWLLCMTVATVVFCSFSAQAGVVVRDVSLVQNEEGLSLNGKFVLQLSPSLTDAVNHGIPLVFQLEAEIRKPRWYWVDEPLYSASSDRRLTYNALVRNYRVTDGQIGRNFVNLSDALEFAARPVSWPIHSDKIRSGETVEVAVRFRLDPTFLPKPFQVVSFGDRDWHLDSDWRVFKLNVPPAMGAK